MGFEQDRLYSTQEVADITGIPRVSLAMYARQGRIKAVKVGKNWRMKGSEVTAFLEKGTMQKNFTTGGAHGNQLHQGRRQDDSNDGQENQGKNERGD